MEQSRRFSPRVFVVVELVGGSTSTSKQEKQVMKPVPRKDSSLFSPRFHYPYPSQLVRHVGTKGQEGVYSRRGEPSLRRLVCSRWRNNACSFPGAMLFTNDQSRSFKESGYRVAGRSSWCQTSWGRKPEDGQAACICSRRARWKVQTGSRAKDGRVRRLVR